MSESEEKSGSPQHERLQKFLAACGIGSRRKCEELIEQGRVEVDRRVVTELGTSVDPESQEIRLDGQRLQASRKVYYLLNKPIGYLSTNYDPAGRPRVIDLLPPTKERLFTVGRLDMQSEGLILVTNDGALAQHLTHPRYGVEKTYLVQVAGQPPEEVLSRLARGVRLAEGSARCVSVTVRSEIKHSTLLEIVLAEGKNREIRRILAQVGHKVMKLKRIAIGGLKLKDLQPGEFQRLSAGDLKLLQDRAPPPKRQKTKRRPPQAQGSEGTGEKRMGDKGAVKKRFNKPADKLRGRPVGRRERGQLAAEAGSTGRKSRTLRPGKARHPFSGKPGGVSGKPGAGKPFARKPVPGKPGGRPIDAERHEDETSAKRHPKPGRGT